MIKNIIRNKLYGFSLKTKDRNFMVSENFDMDMFLDAKSIFKKGDLLSIEELIKIGQLTKESCKLYGDIAEVGVYRGSSAEMIARWKGQKKLFLFDTFEGLPMKSKIDEDIKDLKIGNFKCPMNDVSNRLKNYDNIVIFRGFFPYATRTYIENNKFSFVHLDMDLYESTRDSIKFFWDRLVKGGVILVHDYPSLKGISQAIEEFEYEHKSYKVQLSGKQVMLIKI
jgi:hypothetical protein